MNFLVKNDSIKGIKAITPHNSNPIDQQYNHAIQVTVGGTVECIFKDGTVGTWTLDAGEILKLQPYIITASGTSATGVKGLKLYD